VITTRSEYAVAKMASEVALVNTARRTSLLSATIIRPFNIAGPRQGARGGFVIPRFIEQAMANASLTVYGDGSAVRAFTHVKDVADGIILANRSNAAPPIYNLGNPANKTTILELAQLVIDVVGSKSKIELCDPKRLHGETFAEASDKYPDSDLAQRELRWTPKYDLRTIVADAYDYIRRGRRD
jgi:nucleoside-diphosphate-sugar epimerase